MFNDAIDDQPHSAAAAGFVGMDCNTNPVLLDPGMVADGKNLWCRGDGAIETRPGLKVNSAFIRAHLAVYGASSPDLIIYAAGYYDLPAYEGTVLFTANGAWVISGSGDDLVAAQIVPSAPIVTAAAGSPLVQMVDRLYYLDAFGRINWLIYSAGVWSGATLTTFNGGASMPVWARIVTQGFRLIAIETGGYKLYASAIGSASSATDWVSTENLRVGNGEGDPVKAVVATQGGYITVLNGRSAYQVATAEASVANWSSLQVCRHTGCVEGRTAVVLGQDVFFLSRFGVVSLGALADTVSIAPQDTLSYPIQPWIDRINWSAITNAFATTWRDLYLIALPFDSETYPTRIFAYNLKLRTWQTPWLYGMSTFTWTGKTGIYNWAGLRNAVVTHFSDRTETMLIDTFGQFLRIDETAESDQSAASIAASAPYTATYTATSIPAIVRTRSFTHDQPNARKQAFFLEVECNDNTATDSIVALLLVDGAATIDSPPVSGNSTGYIARWTPGGGREKKRLLLRGTVGVGVYTQTLAPYREASVELYRDAAKMSVRAIVLSAFIDPPFFTS